eukprot:g28466.t1
MPSLMMLFLSSCIMSYSRCYYVGFVLVSNLISRADAVCQTGERPEDVPAPPAPTRLRSERPLSLAGLRALSRLRREVPVDLRLDNQDLRCAEDLCAVVEACDREAQRRQVPPPKTLTLGPWGRSAKTAMSESRSRHEPGCSCHGTLEVLRETSCEASEAAEAFMTTSAIWTRWPLRSICLCELRLSVPLERLGAALAAAAPSVLRLQHLSLRGTALSLLQAFAGHELELLDLSGNALTDDDFEMLLNLAGPKSALKLHGLILSCNPSITQVSLQQLLASEWASQLQLLDLSECSIGPSGALLLGNFLQMPSSVLRDQRCVPRRRARHDVLGRTCAFIVLALGWKGCAAWWPLRLFAPAYVHWM